MKKRLLSALLAIALLVSLLTVGASAAHTFTVIEDGITYTITTTTGEAQLTSVDPALSGEVTIPATVNEYPVVEIGQHAFQDCTGITGVSIPDTVTLISSCAFQRCTSLKSINIPDTVTRIEQAAFQGCTGLESFTLPSGLYELPTKTFDHCTSLTSVVLPEGLTILGGRAFGDCYNLSYVYLPSTLSFTYSYFGNNSAFINCTSLEALAISPDNRELTVKDGVLFSADMTTLYIYPCGKTDPSYVIPDTVTTIHNAGSFSGAIYLQSVTIPDSVTTIPRYAFRDCSSLTEVSLPRHLDSIDQEAFSHCTNLSKVNMPIRLTTISEDAFSDCTNLSEITLPDGLKTIATRAFGNCPKLTSLTIPSSVTNIYLNAYGYDFVGPDENNAYIYQKNNNTQIVGYEDTAAQTYAADNEIPFVNLGKSPADAVLDSLTYTISNGEVTITGASGLRGDVVLPDTIEGYPVTAIAESAFFFSNSDMTSVVIPDTVTSIGNNAFTDCSSLVSVTLPAGLVSMGEEVFFDCPALTTVVIPEGVTALGNYAFLDCASLTGVTLPSTLKSIGMGTFGGCSSLTEIELPEGLEYIGDVAFSGSGIRELYVPASVTYMGEGSFGSTDPELAQDYLLYCVMNSAAHHYALYYHIPAIVYIINFADDTGTGTWTWASDYIYNCAINGLVSGYEDGTFRPDRKITRAEFVTMLYSAFQAAGGIDMSTGEHPFTDCPADWYQTYISWAYQYGIVSGTSKTTFSPDSPITREQMAAILYKYLVTFYGVEPVSYDLSQFPDAGAISAYARPAIQFCVANGLMSGTTEGGTVIIAPKAPTTRAQAATVFYRAFLDPGEDAN